METFQLTVAHHWLSREKLSVAVARARRFINTCDIEPSTLVFSRLETPLLTSTQVCLHLHIQCYHTYAPVQLNNTGNSLWHFVITPDLENFATACRSSKRVINLAGERWTLRA